MGTDFSRGTASQQVVIYAIDRATGLDADPDTGDLNVTVIHLAKSTAMDSFIHEEFNRLSVRLYRAQSSTSAWSSTGRSPMTTRPSTAERIVHLDTAFC